MANNDFDLPRPTVPVPSSSSIVANDNSKVLDYVVNSEGTVVTRTGKTIPTLDKVLSGLTLDALGYAPTPVNGGVWASGQEFNFYNEYMIYNGEAYSPLPATILPYTVGATPDLGFVYQIRLNDAYSIDWDNKTIGYNADDWRGFTEALLAEAGIVDNGLPDTAISSQRLDALTTIFNRSFNSVSEMIAWGGHRVGSISSVFGGTFKTVSIPVTSIENFKALTPISALAFGAVGGGEDDTVAYQAMASAVNLGVIDTVELVNDSRLTSNVTFTGEHSIVSNGAVILNDGGSINANNPVVVSVPLASNATQNAIEVSSSAGIEVGDIVTIITDTLFPYDPRGALFYGEVFKVDRINGNFLFTGTTGFTSEFRFRSQYTTAANARVEVRKNKTLTWGKFKQKNINGSSYGYSVTGYSSPEIHCSQEGAAITGAGVTECYAPKIRGTFIKNYGGAGAPDIGYGVQVNGCRDAIVSKSAFLSNRRGVDFSGRIPSIGGGVYFCSADNNGGGTGSAFGTHGGAADVTFGMNNLGRNEYGFIIRGLNCAIKNNTCREAQVSFVHYTDGANLSVTDNTVEKCQRLIGIYKDVIDRWTNSNVETMGLNIIKGNTAKGILRPAIGLDVTATNKNIYGLVVDGNDLYTAAGTTARAMFAGINETDDVSDFVLGSGCSLYNNNVKGNTNFQGFIHENIKVSSNYDTSLTIHNINAASLGPITATGGSGTGVVSGSIQDGDLSISRGRVTGMIHYAFDITVGGANGIILNIPWLNEQFPSGTIGRQNPMAVMVGATDGFKFARVTGAQSLYIGNSNSSITTTWPIGSYNIFIEFNTRDQHYILRRYQV